jgi:hypothetical protein
MRQHHNHEFALLGVVLHDKHTPSRGGFFLWGVCHDRQVNEYFGSVVGAFAGRLDSPVVQFNQGLDQPKSDSQYLGFPIALGKEFEQLVET